MTLCGWTGARTSRQGVRALFDVHQKVTIGLRQRNGVIRFMYIKTSIAVLCKVSWKGDRMEIGRPVLSLLCPSCPYIGVVQC